MRKKTTKEIANIGVIDLSELILDTELIQLFIPIKSMSDKLQEEVNHAIEISKVEYVEDLKEFRKDWKESREIFGTGKHISRKWSDKGVNIDLMSLDVTINKGTISYCIDVCYVDSEDDCMENNATIEVDLSAYNNDIKKLVIKAMIDKFF